MAQSKQDLVIELVKAGTHTREQIKEQVGCTTGSMASYLSTMSNIAKYTDADMCPVSDENGIMSVTTFALAQEAKAAKAANTKPKAPAKTPAERLDAATKRVARCGNALESAKTRAENDSENRELELRHNLAVINAELADIELARAQAIIDSDDAAEETPEAEDELI